VVDGTVSTVEPYAAPPPTSKPELAERIETSGLDDPHGRWLISDPDKGFREGFGAGQIGRLAASGESSTGCVLALGHEAASRRWSASVAPRSFDDRQGCVLRRFADIKPRRGRSLVPSGMAARPPPSGITRLTESSTSESRDEETLTSDPLPPGKA
jgi:hypothetical protein